MGFFQVILSLINMLLNVNQEAPQNTSTALSKSQTRNALDWSNPQSKVSKYFTVRECLWLPSWNRVANEQDGLNDTIKENLIDLCKSMDVVRDYIESPIIVHVTYRPIEYNKAIGGALHSAHSDGKAMDFHVNGISCDDFRKKIVDEGKLDDWEMRCEDASGTNWVHLDRAPVKIKRFFLP
jgi:uncharacterized protein YcbK (DUF882 family)